MAQSRLARAKKTAKLMNKKILAIDLFLLYTFCHLSTTTPEWQLCYFQMQKCYHWFLEFALAHVEKGSAHTVFKAL